MKSKTQLESSTPNKKDARAFKAALAAIEECLAKPAYDYQRIIICRSNRPGLATALALCSGGQAIKPANAPAWTRKPSVLVIENVGDCGAEALQSIVFLVNQTRKVVVLLAGGRSVSDWQDRHSEIFSRIRRRTHITLEFEI